MSLIFELKRKMWHFILSTIGLLLLISSYNFYGKEFTIHFFLVLLIISLFLDYLRVEFAFNIPIYEKIIREKEKQRLCGLTFGLIAIVMALTLFDFYISLAAIAMGFYGDLAAAIVGKTYGKTKLWVYQLIKQGTYPLEKKITRKFMNENFKNVLDKGKKAIDFALKQSSIFNGKTLQGTLACLMVNIIIAFIFYTFLGYSLIILLFMALFSSLVELYTYHIDDNFAIPFLTAGFGQLLMFLL